MQQILYLYTHACKSVIWITVYTLTRCSLMPANHSYHLDQYISTFTNISTSPTHKPRCTINIYPNLLLLSSNQTPSPLQQLHPPLTSIIMLATYSMLHITRFINNDSFIIVHCHYFNFVMMYVVFIEWRLVL